MTASEHMAHRYWRSPAVAIATLCGVGFVALGLRAVFIPSVTSAGFGLAAVDAVGQGWVMVYGSRTIILGIVALALLVTRQLVPLALLFTIGAITPLFDMFVLSLMGDLSQFALRHSIFIIVLGVVALLLWRKVLSHTETLPGSSAVN